MKTEFTKKGWAEITTKNINVDYTKIPLFAFSTKKSWIKMIQDKPQLMKNRNKCKCCLKKWDKLETIHIWLIFTDKGNKIICDDCFEKILEIKRDNGL